MLCSLLFATTATASTFAEVPGLEALSAASAGVVRGVVSEVQTEACSLGLCSTYTVTVEEVIAGAAPDTIALTLPGGRLGGLEQRASGIPTWELGAEVVLFLRADGTAPLTGLISLRHGRPVDPLSRKIPNTLTDLEGLVRSVQIPNP